MSQSFDTLLRGGRVIDPVNGIDRIADVGVADGKIVAVEADIPQTNAKTVIDVSGKIVIPGMIDTHGHVYQHVTGKFGLAPDLVGVRSGVTTVVDMGGPSCMTIPGFRNFIVNQSATRVLCFISAYLVGGLEGHLYPDLYGPGGLNVEATTKAALENGDLVRGIKAHAEIGGQSRWGLEVIKLGKEISRASKLPLYIHLGQLWPMKNEEFLDADELLEALMPIMEEGDVLAHPFTRHPGGFISGKTGEVHPVVWAALERGVTVDVGHGSHFSFAMARKVLAAGITPFTLGADMHGYNVRVPEATGASERAANPFFGVAPFNLTHSMSGLMALGVPLEKVIAMVTANPAKMLGLSHEIGALTPGFGADISVIEVEHGQFELKDNSREKVRVSELIRPVFALRNGVRFDADGPLVPQPVRLAA